MAAAPKARAPSACSQKGELEATREARAQSVRTRTRIPGPADTTRFDARMLAWKDKKAETDLLNQRMQQWILSASQREACDSRWRSLCGLSDFVRRGVVRATSTGFHLHPREACGIVLCRLLLRGPGASKYTIITVLICEFRSHTFLLAG